MAKQTPEQAGTAGRATQARAREAGYLAGMGRTNEQIGALFGVAPKTVANWRSLYAPAWDDGFLAGVTQQAQEAVAPALARQRDLLASDNPMVAAKVAGDVRAEYGRTLDRTVKRDDLVRRVVREVVGPTMERVIAAALAHIPPDRRQAAELDIRAAVASAGAGRGPIIPIMTTKQEGANHG